MSYTLNLKNSSERWTRIVLDNDCRDVEVCVRFRDEVQRKAIKDSNELRTNQTRRARAFRVASLSKTLVNLAFCIYLIDVVNDPALSFETRVFDLYNNQTALLSNPTILQLLLNQASFAGMNRLLLSPDGTFMFDNAEEFINQAIRYTNARHMTKPDYEYSSVNHILAALLLEQLTGLKIDEVLDKYVFKRFGMTHTTLNKEVLESLVRDEEIELVCRYQITDYLREPTVVPEEQLQYMENSMEKVFLGAWSTADDFDKLFVQLMNAYHNKGSPEDRVISQNCAQTFFDATDGHSLAGMQIPLQDELSFNESPNKSMRYPSEPPLYSLSPPVQTEAYAQVCYKGAAMTGAAATLCMQPDGEVFAIVLANLAAPVDVTPHLTNLFLQDVYNLHPAIPIEKKIQDQRERATGLFRSRCETDRDALAWSSSGIDQFVGTYREIQNDDIIVISKEQTMVLRRGGRASAPLDVRSHGKKVRIVPISFSFALDRQGEWSDIDFILEKSDEHGTTLRTNNGQDRYLRLS